MKQYDFFKQLSYKNFLQKTHQNSSLENVRAEIEKERLGTITNELSLRALINQNLNFSTLNLEIWS